MPFYAFFPQQGNEEKDIVGFSTQWEEQEEASKSRCLIESLLVLLFHQDISSGNTPF